MNTMPLEPLRRAQIEEQLGRSLTEDELSVVSSVDELSEAHREIIRRLGTRPLGMVYLSAVVPYVREKMRTIDRIINEKNWVTVQAWSQEPGLGRWRFRIQLQDQEDILSTLVRCIDVIAAKAPPFGRVQSVPYGEVPSELILDLFVETKQGSRWLPAAAKITFEVIDRTIELVLILDVDIHAFVTLTYIDNATLAATNAPRLQSFLSVLRNELHAQLIECGGVLPTDENGFSAR